MGAGALESPGSPVRAFFGLPLPEEQRSRLADFLAACSVVAPAFRWTPAANLHLTLRFIGAADPVLVDSVAERLSRVRLVGTELALGDLGTFMRGRLIRVVWLALRSGDDALRRLAALADAECVAAGLEGEARAFKAHLTLARARPRQGAILPALPPAPHLEPWRATELVLYSSRLTKTGAVYEPLRTIPLQ